jgi:hypothetical protein
MPFSCKTLKKGRLPKPKYLTLYTGTKQRYISLLVDSGRIVKPGELESLHYYSPNNSGKNDLLYKNNITGIFPLKATAGLIRRAQSWQTAR